MMANPNAMGGNPQQIQQIIGAEIDMALKLLGELDALSVGAKFAATGATGTMVFQPLPDTSLARIGAGLKPAQTNALDTFDSPVVMAGAWDVSPAVTDEFVKLFDEFLSKIEVPAGEENKLKSFVESYKKMAGAVSGGGAFVWNTGAGQGFFHITEIIGLKPNTDLHALLREYLGQVGGLMTNLGMPINMDVKYDEKVETYRNLPIDRTTMKFALAPEKENDEQAKTAMKAIQAMYGEQMLAFGTQVKDSLVMTVGEPDSKALKAEIDRLLDNKKGNLVTSAEYAAAVAGLPKDRAVVGVMSLENLILLFSKMSPRMGGGENAAANVKFEKPSAAGFAVTAVPKGFAVDFNVPIQEMLNIRQAVMGMMGMMMP
jgi:hypothetical protein